MQLVLLTSFQRFKKPTHTTHCAAALRFDLASYWCWVSWFPLPWELMFKTTAQISVSSSTFLSSLSLFPSPASFSGCLISFFPIRSGWFCVIASYIYMYHGFSVGVFWWWWWWFFVSILFWGFFAILNHAALKAVTGLTLKEDIGRISFRSGRQLTYPTVLVSWGQNNWPQEYHWKEKKRQPTAAFMNFKSLASGHHVLK